MKSNASQLHQGGFTSHLFDEKSFYTSFLSDLEHCEREAIIESPFVSENRMKILLPFFKRLVKRQVKVYVVTKDPSILEELDCTPKLIQ